MDSSETYHERAIKTPPFDVSPLNSVVNVSIAEFKLIDIEMVVGRFEPIVEEFCALTESIRDRKPKYNVVFQRFIQFLCDEYDLKITPIYVRPNAYDPSTWGPLYWSFMHLSSILLTHAFVNNKTDDLLDFPLLIYNIDSILPCSLCVSHYASIKRNVEIKECLKNISFGFVVSGLQTFHNIVSRNVDSTPEYASRASRPTFTIVDFAQTYNCIELTDSSLKMSNTYVRNSLDWQSETHSILTTLLAVFTQQTYVRASSLIKRVLYNDESAKSQPIYTEEELLFERMTKDEVLERIARAVLLQLGDNAAAIKENISIFNVSIFKFYSRFPEVVEALLSNANNVENTKDDSKANERKILSVLSEIRNNINLGSTLQPSLEITPEQIFTPETFPPTSNETNNPDTL